MKVTISGSFRKFYNEICRTYDIFEQNGITVLSPKKSRIINPDDEFIFLETDSGKFVRETEDKHLESIGKSNFVYIVNPNGYIGDSVKFEMGYAHAHRKPIYSSDAIDDLVLKEYVAGIFSPEEWVNSFEKIKKMLF